MEQEANAKVGHVPKAHEKLTIAVQDESEIEIILNGKTRRIQGAISILELLKLYHLPEKNCAVEHNHRIVVKSEYGNVKILEGDQVEIVRFVGGG